MSIPYLASSFEKPPRIAQRRTLKSNKPLNATIPSPLGLLLFLDRLYSAFEPSVTQTVSRYEAADGTKYESGISHLARAWMVKVGGEGWRRRRGGGRSEAELKRVSTAKMYQWWWGWYEATWAFSELVLSQGWLDRFVFLGLRRHGNRPLSSAKVSLKIFLLSSVRKTGPIQPLHIFLSSFFDDPSMPLSAVCFCDTVLHSIVLVFR